MPTLLALLNIPCKVSFTGQDIFSSAYRPRAFMATYQNLGYLENNCLTILSPVRKIEQFSVRYDKDGTAIEIPLRQQRNDFIQKAEAYYQFTNIYLSR
jgi:arylsulfatase